MERTKWQDKLENVNLELDMASNQIYLAKRRLRNQMRDQFNCAKSKEDEMKNYIAGIRERNVYLLE